MAYCTLWKLNSNYFGKDTPCKRLIATTSTRVFLATSTLEFVQCVKRKLLREDFGKWYRQADYIAN